MIQIKLSKNKAAMKYKERIKEIDIADDITGLIEVLKLIKKPGFSLKIYTLNKSTKEAIGGKVVNSFNFKDVSVARNLLKQFKYEVFIYENREGRSLSKESLLKDIESILKKEHPVYPVRVAVKDDLKDYLGEEILIARTKEEVSRLNIRNGCKPLAVILEDLVTLGMYYKEMGAKGITLVVLKSVFDGRTFTEEDIAKYGCPPEASRAR